MLGTSTAWKDYQLIINAQTCNIDYRVKGEFILVACEAKWKFIWEKVYEADKEISHNKTVGDGTWEVDEGGEIDY